MNKYCYTLLIAAVAATCATARPRTLQEARTLAEQELSAQLGRTVVLGQQPQHAARRGDVASDSDFLPYYHFSNDEAFVIIAGSDLLPAVIGYGEGRAFDAELPLPSNLQGWLDIVAETEQYLESEPLAAAQQAEALQRAASASLSPIATIMTCRWGQNTPYNKLCPTMRRQQNSVVGCIATALGQIMYTQKFPKQSCGNVRYENYGKLIEADLDGTTYDYDLMHDNHSGGATTPEEDDEVAKLCFNVGIASMMQYGETSVTITRAALRGLVNNFGMTKVAHLRRQYYSLDEWNRILQTELLDGNSICFCAQSSAGGHAFVLDGMDKRGRYHVNWGWDGHYNGYFDVSLLRTDGVGTGASENRGFCMQQEVLVNLCDPEKVTHWYNPMNTLQDAADDQDDAIRCEPACDVARGKELTLSAHTVNNGCEIFEGKAGVLVMKDGEQFDLAIGTRNFVAKASRVTVNQKGGFSWWPGKADISATYTLPADMEDGTYRLYLVMQPAGGTDIDAVRQYHYSPSYWTLTVVGDELTLSHDRIGIPVVASKWNFDREQLTTGPSTVSCVVLNTSDEQIATRYYLQLTKPDGKDLGYVSAGGVYDEPFTLSPGESTTIDFGFNADADGEWQAKLYGVAMGLDDEAKQLLDVRTFSVELSMTRGAVLKLKGDPQLENETMTNGEELTMTFEVENTGADYDGQMSIRLFSKSTTTASSALEAEIVNESVQISAGEITTVTISGTLDIPSMTKNKSLYARIYYLFGDEMIQLAEKKYTTVRVYATTGIEQIKADDESSFGLRDEAIFDGAGQRIMSPASGHLQPGIYIVGGRKKLISD